MTIRRTTRLRAVPRHGIGVRRHAFRNGAAVLAVGAVAFVTAGGAFAFDALQGNITTHDIDALVGTSRPTPTPSATTTGPVDPNADHPLNILVMGSDARIGAIAEAEGEVEGMRSDTTLVVHVSADRTRADIVSIPRDLLVDIPACPHPDGTESAPRSDAMFNSAFATGGEDGQVEYAAACTIKTVEQMTGVYIDDFVVVDFAGFIGMIDALGGVPMCLPEAVSDRYTGLNLPAGLQVLDGQQALLYARARHDLGDGSDISRIGRQQLLIAAMIRQVLSKNLLTELPALYQFLNAATQSVTAGPTIGQIPNMVGFANSLRGVPAGAVSFVTVPFDWAGARVRPNADSAALWAAIATDQPISSPAVEPTVDATEATAPADTAPSTPTTASATPSPTTTPSPQPWDVITGDDQGGVCG